jgi:hypothetical protein
MRLARFDEVHEPPHDGCVRRVACSVEMLIDTESVKILRSLGFARQADRSMPIDLGPWPAPAASCDGGSLVDK